jgi:hypothetical protein
MASDVRYTEEGIYTFLIAFVVAGDSRGEAEASLLLSLPRPKGHGYGDRQAYDWLDCWWVAEDDNQDGSDNDAAVFVPPYQQTAWARLVRNAQGKCPGCLTTNDCNCSNYENARIVISALEELKCKPDLLRSRGWTVTQVQEIIDERMEEL